MPNLDYAELRAATAKTLELLWAEGDGEAACTAILLAALTDIAVRAFEQAAWGYYWPDVKGIDEPAVLLSDTLAALKAPVNDTSKQRAAPLTDAEVLKKLPAIVCTGSGKRPTELELKALIEKIRWA